MIPTTRTARLARSPFSITRRGLLAGAVAAPLAGIGRGPAQGQDLRFFRIATGTTGGTYFPIGGLIANAISNPPGSRPCERGGSCGVPGLIAVAQATQGSVENAELLRSGAVEAALMQADVAFWAYTGGGVFAGRTPFTTLRTLGTLYTETVHVVARADRGIAGIADLRGKAISVGEEGSGTLADARVVLDAYGLTERDIEARYLKPATAADRLARGELDAFFMVGGTPVAAVTDAANQAPIRLLDIDGPVAAGLRERLRFFGEVAVPEGTYPGVPAARTLSVGAELLVRADSTPDLILGVVRALWHENTRKLLSEGHPRGKEIEPQNALAGIAVPLHPGAERYYRLAGLLGDAANEAPTAQP